MAYDPNDAGDKKIVADLVKAAVDKALLDAGVEHEADIAGLKEKNKELTAKLKKKLEGEGDPAEVARLELQIETLQGEKRQLEKDHRAATRNVEKLTSELDGERTETRTLLVDNGLTEALTTAKVAASFLPAVKALLIPKVEVTTVDGKRVAQIAGKSLGDYVQEWSQGDDGKHYVSAEGNSGAGGLGSRQQLPASSKTMKRAAWDTLNTSDPVAASKVFADGTTLTD